MDNFPAYSKVGRRRFLQLAAGGVILLAGAPHSVRAAQHTVGVGREQNGYVATMRALNASGEWNSTLLAGRTVLIKPNLVVKQTAETGATTDPQVVRALVDTALEAGAVAVKIVEGFSSKNNFAECGYNFFVDYDAQGRVSLVDLSTQPHKLVDVPNGLVYQQMYMPEMLYAPDTVLVSAAKLKVHSETLVTLAVKNAFGLSSEASYRVQAPDAVGRFAMHDRGVQQAVVDHNLARPFDFAVVDGIWGMERVGPYGGVPVAFDTVFVGRNAVAVDRVCLAAMGIPNHWAYHLTLASNKGLGPSHLGEIDLRGDAFEARVFVLPDVPPVIEVPVTTPSALSLAPARVAQSQPQQGATDESVTIRYGVNRRCDTRIDIVQTSEQTTEVINVRLLQDWTVRAAGNYTIAWDGRDNEGALVPPGRYTARVEATHGEQARNAFASAWVTILDDANEARLQVEPALVNFVGNVAGALPPAQTVAIASDDDDLAWEAATSTPWLHLAETSGTGPGTLVLAADSAGLEQGVYTGQITITGKQSGAGDEITRVVQVKLTLSRSDSQQTSADLEFEAEVGGTLPPAQVMTVAAGGEAVAWIVSQAPVWVGVSAATGNAPSEIAVTPKLEGVAAGIYVGQITVVKVEDASVVMQSSVALRVTQAVERLHLPYASRQ